MGINFITMHINSYVEKIESLCTDSIRQEFLKSFLHKSYMLIWAVRYHGPYCQFTRVTRSTIPLVALGALSMDRSGLISWYGIRFQAWNNTMQWHALYCTTLGWGTVDLSTNLAYLLLWFNLDISFWPECQSTQYGHCHGMAMAVTR